VWTGFGLVIRFIDHLQIVTVCYDIVNLHTLQISRAHIKSSQSTFTRRFLVTDPNNVLCLHLYWLANVSELTPRLATISKQPPSPLNDWTHLHCRSQLVPLITSRHGPHRKHRSSLLYFNCCRGNMFVCEAVTQ
jgi:hypothetical protein